MSEFETLLERMEHPCELVFVTVSGAHLYGFASADSDVDLRGVHLLGPDRLLGLDTGPYTHDAQAVVDGREVDLVTHDLEKFIRLMLKRNGYVLEQLLSPLVVRTSAVHQRLKDLADGCITRHHAHHYLGFSKNQWQLFRKDDPPRVKPLLYVYRVLLTGIHLMQTGRVEANLPRLNERFRLSYIDELIDRKAGGSEAERLDDADLAFHRGEYERLTVQLETARDKSTLPVQATSRDALNELLLEARLGAIN